MELGTKDWTIGTYIQQILDGKLDLINKKMSYTTAEVHMFLQAALDNAPLPSVVLISHRNKNHTAIAGCKMLEVLHDFYMGDAVLADGRHFNDLTEEEMDCFVNKTIHAEVVNSGSYSDATELNLIYYRTRVLFNEPLNSPNWNKNFVK